MLGAVNEYHRLVTSERTAEAKRRAVARGVPPFARVPPGYRKREDGRLEPDDGEATTVADAFRLRVGGATIADVRAYLRDHGVERSYHGVESLLGSRIVLGEIHFGELVNESAHPAIVDRETWNRVQRMRLPRGRRAKSERLLARLGILRCGTCGSRMVIGNSHTPYAIYRCPPIGDCPQRVTISARRAEEAITEETKRLLRGMTGTASTDAGIAEAEEDVTRAEAELDAAVIAFSGLDDVRSAQERLTALREAREEARERLEELRGLVAPVVTVSAEDWDELNIGERRDLICAVIERAVVAPGRAADRLTIEPRL
jgi:hypothetical protein